MAPSSGNSVDGVDPSSIDGRVSSVECVVGLVSSVMGRVSSVECVVGLVSSVMGRVSSVLCRVSSVYGRGSRGECCGLSSRLDQ